MGDLAPRSDHLPQLNRLQGWRAQAVKLNRIFSVQSEMSLLTTTTAAMILPPQQRLQKKPQIQMRGTINWRKSSTNRSHKVFFKLDSWNDILGLFLWINKHAVCWSSSNRLTCSHEPPVETHKRRNGSLLLPFIKRNMNGSLDLWHILTLLMLLQIDYSTFI